MKSILLLISILILDPGENPIGTVKIKNHYVDPFELLNIHWMEYIHYKSQELDSAQLKRILPDSTNQWYTSPANRYKPIVLITYDQALGYCAWRSKVVSERMGKKVTYRLPTKDEWKEIAEEVLKTDGREIEKELTALRKKIKNEPDQYFVIDQKVRDNRVHDLFDSVSEMTMEEGIAMGSNNHDLVDPKTCLTRIIKYKGANPYLGFRCVAEIE